MSIEVDVRTVIPTDGTGNGVGAVPTQATVQAVGASPAPPSFEPPPKIEGSWPAAIGLLAPIVPIPAIVVTIAIYYVMKRFVSPSYGEGLPSVLIPIVGVICVGVLWLFAAVLVRRQTVPANANPKQYGRLLGWRSQFGAKCGSSVSQYEPTEMVALDEARAACKTFDMEFRARGNRWSTQAGYLTLWRLRHRAEEAWIGYAPSEQVAAVAWDIRLRLQGSRMDTKNRAELQRGLATAIATLNPNARKYLSRDEQEKLAQDNSKEPATRNEVTARNIVRSAISDINSYQDDRYSRLLDLRRQYILAATYIGSLCYLLTVFGTVLRPANAGTWPELMLGAGTLYLVGAAFGLLYRLYDESRARAAVEDYGLSMIRLVTAPVLSGLAGVAGAVFLAIVLDKSTLPDAFNLVMHPNTLLYAAVFGLTPNVLISYMQRQARQYIADIESVKASSEEPAGGQPTS